MILWRQVPKGSMLKINDKINILTIWFLLVLYKNLCNVKYFYWNNKIVWCVT